MKYKYKPPKYFTKQEVSFIDHRGNQQTGTIRWIETHYTYKHTAYHIYLVQVAGWENRRHLEEEDILYVITEKEKK